MTHTFCADSISDLHKDAYGFRPSSGFWDNWEASTDDEKQIIWDDLCKYLDIVMENEKFMEQEAAARFEASVTATIESGAGDRETAIRWLFDAEDLVPDSTYDQDQFCYSHGLPYRYFFKQAEAA